MTKDEIGQYFGDKNWHKKGYKEVLLSRFNKELKGSTNADFYVDKSNNHIYLKGNKSGAWVDTGDIL